MNRFLFSVAILLASISGVFSQSKVLKVYKNGVLAYSSQVSNIDSITFADAEITEEGVVINGVRWATRNVDAPGTFAALPESAGMLYQWNKRVGWSSTDPLINSDGGTTWDDSTPDGTKWEKINDPCPSGWRVPTLNEIKSLLDVNNGSWTTINGVIGRVFGANPDTLFLPATSFRKETNGTLNGGGIIGNYWSNTLSGNTFAYYLTFGINGANWSVDYRKCGYSLRCVAE